jgi:hypothetical protein
VVSCLLAKYIISYNFSKSKIILTPLLCCRVFHFQALRHIEVQLHDPKTNNQCIIEPYMLKFQYELACTRRNIILRMIKDEGGSWGAAPAWPEAARVWPPHRPCCSAFPPSGSVGPPAVEQAGEVPDLLVLQYRCSRFWQAPAASSRSQCPVQRCSIPW